jgi:hypothetical protein
MSPLAKAAPGGAGKLRLLGIDGRDLVLSISGEPVLVIAQDFV